LHNKNKAYDKAIQDFTKAIELNPSYGMAYYNRAIAKENINDIKGACSDWRIAADNSVANAKSFYDADCR
jgi:tetratricopeptide (TPR) repeat protein